MMASLEASLRAEAMRGTDDLAALVQNVNRLVYDATAENRYASSSMPSTTPQRSA